MLQGLGLDQLQVSTYKDQGKQGRPCQSHTIIAASNLAVMYINKTIYNK